MDLKTSFEGIRSFFFYFGRYTGCLKKLGKLQERVILIETSKKESRVRLFIKLP